MNHKTRIVFAPTGDSAISPYTDPRAKTITVAGKNTKKRKSSIDQARKFVTIISNLFVFLVIGDHGVLYRISAHHLEA
jgi:hypothetical protein